MLIENVCFIAFKSVFNCSFSTLKSVIANKVIYVVEIYNVRKF